MRRIAAKPSSQRWSKFWKENHQKLAFREGVQPWDLASFSGRIESYRFIMDSSKSKPYSASEDFLACRKLAVALSTSWPWHGGPPPMIYRGQCRGDASGVAPDRCLTKNPLGAQRGVYYSVSVQRGLLSGRGLLSSPRGIEG